MCNLASRKADRRRGHVQHSYSFTTKRLTIDESRTVQVETCQNHRTVCEPHDLGLAI